MSYDNKTKILSCENRTEKISIKIERLSFEKRTNSCIILDHQLVL